MAAAWQQLLAQAPAHPTSASRSTSTRLGILAPLGEQVANVGDSSAVLAELSLEGELQQPGRYLTADHRLSNPEERDRLKGLGIMLGQGGTRLYGLNLGRCLGDRYLKVCSIPWAWECSACPVQAAEYVAACSLLSDCRAGLSILLSSQCGWQCAGASVLW